MILLFILPLFGLMNMAITCIPRESEDCHTAIRVSNNSEKKLRISVRQFNPTHFPDPFDISVRHLMWLGTVNAGEQNNRNATEGRSCFEHLFRSNRDTLFLFIFDADVIENTPWEIVARDYLVLRRYDLTLEDLQRLNWQVTYPPTAAMRDVKMFPPFGE
jgi:hypothetical protein